MRSAASALARLGRAASVALLTMALAGCDAPPATVDPPRALPSYDARAAELFDDAVEPAAVGYTLDSTPPSKNVYLRARTVTADSVVRARVVTLTTSPEGDGAWHMGLRTLETVAGHHAPESFTLVLAADGPSSGVMRGAEGRVTGMTLLAFLRDFKAPPSVTDSPAQLHFHIGPDSQDERSAVREAALLGEVR